MKVLPPPTEACAIAGNPHRLSTSPPARRKGYIVMTPPAASVPETAGVPDDALVAPQIAPAAVVDGQVAWNSVDELLYTRRGGQWLSVSGTPEQ